MKRFLSFILPIVVTAVFLMPATVQAKKIKCGQFLYYEGEVKEKLPHGQGEMLIKQDNNYISSTSVKGMFSMDGSVTDAVVRFSDRYIEGSNTGYHPMYFKGKLSYTAVNDILTLHLHEGKFEYYKWQSKKSLESNKAVTLAVTSGSDIIIQIDCTKGGGVIKNPQPFEIEKKFYVDEFISSMVGGIETIKGKTTYQIIPFIDKNDPDEKQRTAFLAAQAKNFGVTLPNESNQDYLMPPFSIASKGSKWNKQTLADGTIVEPQKVVFPNGDFYDATFNTFSKTFPDGTISTDKKNYEFDANVAGYSKFEIGGQQKVVIKYSDGNVFTGRLSKIKPEEPINEIDSEFIQNVIYKVKSIAELMSTYKYWFGTLAKPKGNTTVYWGGKTKEKVIAEEKKAKEDYINYWKNEGKKAEALYNELCRKFGKKYVDAAGSGRIAIGTPEGLLDYMRGVHHHHTQADVYIKEHATHTVGQPWAYDWIYITNGKVSYITTKYSYDEHAW